MVVAVTIDADKFAKDMNNIVQYSLGFIDGVNKGKLALMQDIGKLVVQGLKEFVDISARLNPMSLHHVYEWYNTGSPEARLFDIEYVATNRGLSLNSSFRQSVSIRKGSNVPFYNKAEIMENGIPVTIRPISANVLRFEEGGETVYTKSPVRINDPGGDYVQGSYERVFNQFFQEYFTQSFLRSSGILDHLEDPTAFKTNLNRGKNGGRSAGISVGFNWILRRKR